MTDASDARPLCEVTFSIWVIYGRKITPKHFVARRWIVGPGICLPTADVEVADSLPAIRRKLPVYLTGPIARSQNDDDCIVEVWI